MTVEKFIEIFDNTDSDWTGDNAVKGLLILCTILDPNEHELIEGAGHDEIWGPQLETLIEAGITEDQVKQLALLNWSIEDSEYLTCFV